LLFSPPASEPIPQRPARSAAHLSWFADHENIPSYLNRICMHIEYKQNQ
jgi:hypothetical protein